MGSSRKKVHIFIVSDATGMTAEMVISAVMVQFKEIEPTLMRFPYVRTREQIEEILNRAEAVRGTVIYSLVSKELRAWVCKENRRTNVYTIDLLGPVLEGMGKFWNLVPILKPGIFRGVEEESFRLADSIDFTLSHDDGQGIETLEKADLIVMGVSRTSKTPTSLYLSCNNCLRVANIPIIPDLELSEKVFKLKTTKVGFTISPERLAYLRRKRVLYPGPSADYTDMTMIKKELAYSHRIFNRIEGMDIVDVTHTSIEEVANEVLKLGNFIKP